MKRDHSDVFSMLLQPGLPALYKVVGIEQEVTMDGAVVWCLRVRHDSRGSIRESLFSFDYKKDEWVYEGDAVVHIGIHSIA